MKLFKRSIAIMLSFIFLLSFSAVVPNAAGSEKWTFIDGINVVRSVNTAIIYRGVSSTGQNQWGHNIIVDADGVVTDIIQGGDAAGSNLSVPEGGMVISSAGTKIQWFKDNIKKGSTVFYDSYSQRLFVCDANGSYDPYFTKDTAVSGDIGKYYLSDPSLEGAPVYSYTVSVNAEGKVVSRGENAEVPEGGFTVSAGNVSGVSFLIMYAPVGASCVIENGRAVFTYSKTMLGDTVSLLLDSAKLRIEEAKAAFLDFDVSKAEGIIASAETVELSTLDAKTASILAYSLETELASALSDNAASELRGAFHTPDETSKGAIRKTLNSLKDSGLNTIILKLSNGYGSFIPLPQDSKFKQDEKFGGFDVLAAYIELCEEMDVELALCIDVYFNEYASLAEPEWLSQTNGKTKGLADKYFSPASREFEDYFISYLEYIITHYEISTLMFDSLRYPKFSESGDLGYDNETLTRFSQEYEVPIAKAEKIKTELFASPYWKNWVEFRTKLVDGTAKRISNTVREKRPDITVIAVAARDSVDHYYMQNATGWMENGLFDGLCVSLYNGISEEADPLPETAYYDDYVTEKYTNYAAYTGQNAFCFAALESDATLNANLISNAVSSLRNAGSDGFIFSSLTGYISQHYGAPLKNGVLKNEAVSPFGDTAEVMKAILEYSKTKISETLVSFGGCSEAIAALAGARINDAITLLSDGVLTVEDAKTLESDIAIRFADSPAKSSVLNEFGKVLKLANLAKSEFEGIEPPIVDPPESVDPPDENSEPENITESEPIEESTVSEIESNAPLYPLEQEKGVDIGAILIYCFVGIAFAAAIAGTVVAVKRAKNKPANRHLPKAALEEKEKNGDDLD